jgi:glycosyltransferase involved in cell wall biosynthesis
VTLLVDVHHIGGYQTGNETIARNLMRELVTLTTAGELVFATSQAGEAIVAAETGVKPSIVSSSSLFRVLHNLPALARKSGATAILTQYTKPLTRVPCVVMVHDLSPFDPLASRWMTRRFRARVRMSIDISARRGAALVACSQFTRRGLIERYSLEPRKVVFAPCAVDPELAALLDAIPSDLPKAATPRVIAVGNVLPRKNLTVLGAAIRRVRDRGLPVELRVVGSVPPGGESICADLTRLLGPAVSFSGYVTSAKLASEYAAAHMLAFPSLFEGFGIPAIEAMYAGVPVITSDRSSLPEVVGDAGVVVPASDVDAWSDALESLLLDPARQSDLIARGRIKAREASWNASGRIVLDALRDAAESR